MTFVTWEKPYEMYAEMDRDLLILHNLVRDVRIAKEGVTKLLGPFGVFRKQQKLKGEKKSYSTSYLDVADSITPAASIATAGSVSAGSVATATSGTTTPNIDNIESVNSAEWSQAWLSKELRDDAFITAAALNADTSLLEFINKFSEPNFSGAPTPRANELVNLVFHRSSNQQASSSFAPPTTENLEILLHASLGVEDDESTDLVEGLHSTQMPSSIMSIVQAPLSSAFDLSIPGKIRYGLPTTALQVQPLTRYLLNYYITEVADLMTVIPLTENPWKTIYFPKALSAIGELSALGMTLTPKNALLNAILAVSAFNLQSKFPKNSDSMRYYLNLGIRLRNQASLFIKRLINAEPKRSNASNESDDDDPGVDHCVKHEKYKDVLCGVMTMISVDLVWGTMQDTHFYIKWCGKVIQAKMKFKKKLSSKGRILHRIFSSLKLIQDLTCLDVEMIKGDYNTGYDVNGDKFGGKSVNTNINRSPLFEKKKLINTKKNDENFATDALFGLPNSLILLFGETVQLLRTKIYHQENLPDDFTKRVNDLNRKLVGWRLDWNLTTDEVPNELVESSSDPTNFISPMHETTYHHIYSFYHALTIYFNRLIKEVPLEKLQTKVGRTLHHLNAIQRLIAQGDAAIIPLFWQGFIAGCEATSHELQMGFKKWGVDIAQYLGSYWGARQIMLEVWRRKRANENRADWVSVIGDWEMNLMLN